MSTTTYQDGSVRQDVTIASPFRVANADLRERHIESTGLGIFLDGLGMNAGFYETDLTLLDPGCRIVIWVKSREQLVNLDQFVDLHRDVCIEQRKMEQEK